MASKLPEWKDIPIVAPVGEPKKGWWKRDRSKRLKTPSAPEPRKGAAPAKAAGWRTRLGLSSSYSRDDILLFASGTVLAGFCAFFPWYVFLNQDQFGIRAVKLENIPSSGPSPRSGIAANRIASETATKDNRETDLDTFTTGTTPAEEEEKDLPRIADQPFPVATPEFELVHVANGRAMIQDDQGLYVVQRGSLLPDNSRVAKIEKRDGHWVLVTTADRVLEIAN